MAEAFKLKDGAACKMHGNRHWFPVREGTIGEVTGYLFADVGPLFLKLSPQNDGTYQDSQGRVWEVVDENH